MRCLAGALLLSLVVSGTAVGAEAVSTEASFATTFPPPGFLRWNAARELVDMVVRNLSIEPDYTVGGGNIDNIMVATPQPNIVQVSIRSGPTWQNLTLKTEGYGPTSSGEKAYLVPPSGLRTGVEWLYAEAERFSAVRVFFGVDQQEARTSEEILAGFGLPPVPSQEWSRSDGAVDVPILERWLGFQGYDPRGLALKCTCRVDETTSKEIRGANSLKLVHDRERLVALEIGLWIDIEASHLLPKDNAIERARVELAKRGYVVREVNFSYQVLGLYKIQNVLSVAADGKTLDVTQDAHSGELETVREDRALSANARDDNGVPTQAQRQPRIPFGDALAVILVALTALIARQRRA